MADKTGIEWTDATLNPIRARARATGQVGWYCEHASPGCKNCYAEGFNANRLGTRLPFKPGHRDDVEHFLDEAILLQPLRWRRPRRIFLGSMTDLFGDWVPVAWLDQIFAVAALSPQHTFQVLTKRSARMRAYLSDPIVRARIAMAMARITARGTLGGMERGRQIVKGMEGDGWPLPNVWVGVSAEDQIRADERVPDLLATPAAVRFVSAEPLLGPIDFTNIGQEGARFTSNERRDALRGWIYDEDPHDGSAHGITTGYGRLDGIFVGGESGPNARPMHPDWARKIRDDCAAAGTAYLFKQWGTWGPGAAFEATPSARQAYRGEIQTLVIPGSRDIKLAIPTRMDDRLGPALTLERYGKKAAGRLLDGVQHDGMPEVRVSSRGERL